MLPVQTLYCFDSSLTTVYGPWFARGADSARFVIEVPKMSSTASSLVLGVQVCHKNPEETGDGSAVGSVVLIDGSMLASDQRFVFEVNAGFKELVRYQFALIDFFGSGAGWVTFRMLAPAWFNKV